jgi:hypothetical protein
MHHFSILQQNIYITKILIKQIIFLKVQILKVLKVQKYVEISGISVSVYYEKICSACLCVNTKQKDPFQPKLICYDMSCIIILRCTRTNCTTCTNFARVYVLPLVSLFPIINFFCLL